MSKKPEKRYCLQCGDVLIRRKHKCGQIENLRAFTKRKFCSKPCYYQHRREAVAREVARREREQRIALIGIDTIQETAPASRKTGFIQRIKNAFRELTK